MLPFKNYGSLRFARYVLEHALYTHTCINIRDYKYARLYESVRRFSGTLPVSHGFGVQRVLVCGCVCMFLCVRVRVYGCTCVRVCACISNYRYKVI